MFFGRKANGVKKERVSHVGIYLGNGKFIHAGAPKAKVAVESLWHNDPSFAKKRLASLLHVKRIIGFVGEYGIEVIDY